MNNAFIAEQSVSLELETPVDNTVHFRERESELLAIIEAINKIAGSLEWQLLQKKIFDGVVESLERRLQTEIKKKPLNGPMIHSLNGQIEWAEKYTNFASLADIYKQELLKIRIQLNAKERS